MTGAGPHDHPLHAGFMARALELAHLGLGRCSPNPPVGAVLVAHGRIVGEGFHRQAGSPHAEVVALARAGVRARGADCYVTLEPCCHWGRTPGCAQALAAAGVRRVFYAAADPDPKVRGRGASAARAAGLVVVGDVLCEEAERFYAAYAKHRTTGRPLVAAKMAVTLDGKVATRKGKSQWISCEASRRLVHQWRDEYDAVMVGVGTVLADDPELTCRREDRVGRNPLRLVVDSWARTPPHARALTAGGTEGCIVAVTEDAPVANVDRLITAGVEVWPVPRNAQLQVDLQALVGLLGSEGVVSVLLEGGPGLLAGALEAGIVDRLLVFYAPKVFGGAEAPGMVAGPGVAEIEEGEGWRLADVCRIGEDLLVEAWRCSPA